MRVKTHNPLDSKLDQAKANSQLQTSRCKCD